MGLITCITHGDIKTKQFVFDMFFCDKETVFTLLSVEHIKLKTYLPIETHWSGYVPFSSNQNRFPHIFIILS